MATFWPAAAEAGEAPTTPVLAGATLLLPGVSIGNVGQLAVDLLVHSLKLRRVGFLESQYVLPSVGNDAYSATGTGKLAVEMELYGADGGVFVLQQRSPPVVGCQRLFAAELMDWVAASGFAKLVVLASIDSALREDLQITGPQLRYVATGGAEEDARCAAMGLQALQAGEGRDGIEESQLRIAPWPLIQEARHRGADSLALLAYASEGDNVPDAMHMASAAVQYLGMVPPEEAAAFRWELPGSWCNLYGPPVNEMMY
mmetsp:Transcript_13676/g.34449  ORF Transcript_13676/g.34449 Transcript_13676/m.34449 type:complete len:258 (-) Transcript_13676:352-1125(-)